MHIEIAENKEEWNKFILDNSNDEFLQSWEWGDFQKSYGREVWRFIVQQDENILALANTVCMRVPGKRSFIYIPRGPVWKKDIKEETILNVWSLFTQNWRLIALESKSFFVRIEPAIRFKYQSGAEKDYISKFLLGRNWKRIKSVQPRYNSIISLRKFQEELLKDMHPKTRYNIKLADKKGLVIRTLSKSQELSIFWKLLRITTKRNAFSLYDFSYYRKLFHILYSGEDKHQRSARVKIWMVEKENRPLAAAMVILFGKTAYYLFGGSNDDERNLMPTYLLHWEIIKWANNRKYYFYDLGGIKPPEAPSGHPWTGLTKFKRGFGGHTYYYPGTFDFPYNESFYSLYNSARKIRRFIRVIYR